MELVISGAVHAAAAVVGSGLTMSAIEGKAENICSE
jgi:hypothetical protein